MKVLRNTFILAASLVLVACGGSSSGSFDRGGAAKMSVSAETTSVPAKGQHFVPNPAMDYTIQVNVEFLGSDNRPVPDGTEVNLSSSSSGRGVVAPIDEPESTGGQATSTTSGGTASFWFVSGSNQGEVTLTASGTAPSGDQSSSRLNLNVIEPSDGAARLSIEGPTEIPANKAGASSFLGSPYVAEYRIRYLGPDGEPGIVRLDEDDRHTAQVTISPTRSAMFSTLMDPEFEFAGFDILWGTGPVLVQGGQGIVFVHAQRDPGTVTLSAAAFDIDEDDDQVYSAEIKIDVIDHTEDFLPAQLDFSVSPDPVYIQGSGGSTSKSLSVDVRDSGGNAVPDPEGDGHSYNNVRLQLEAPANSGARLVGTGADGSVSGTDIRVRTLNGVANFALNSGTETGSHRIIATVDRADNNVDNEMTDPLTAETTIQVGDGRLFSLELVQPSINALMVNRAVTDIGGSEEQIIGDNGVPVPPDPDGTYSLTVTVQGVDQVGHPVLPGTVVSFGKIDSPLSETNPSYFVFSGEDGNPSEGGDLFSVLDSPEGFLDDPNAIDESVETGDTLALFGKSIPGNREHEAARSVADVVDDRTVRVSEPFNPNDQSGNIVDDGYVIPWVIGRARMGVIDESATLGDQGRATVQLTYPIHAVGRPTVVWAQSQRTESGGTKTVADVNSIRLPGVAPLELSVTPSTIPGNVATPVLLCLRDALGAPVNQAAINGSLVSGQGIGSLDGDFMPTTTQNATGTDGLGCVETEVKVENMLAESGNSVVLFSVGEATASLSVVAPEAGMLMVEPSNRNDLSPTPQDVNLTLTLLTSGGEPLSGVQLIGSCDGGNGSLSITDAPGVTDEDGETTATVEMDMSICGDGSGEGFPREGICEFTTASGSPVGTFTANGFDLSESGVSPSPCD
ncbi:hypothetical protein IC757_12560 [Wenzhouxiangella sp. AB-CW3]|uniref:hypothetical protein n=1 Tax=Wenzhouxiangella sp. AB-CW3 TaxID=2771012 RepID=UPI00168A84DD|nr:hypothetical protein [Wenzhouxiangella sp. AB-CW3]QOC21854.1 hypothetical protein IC757_12560 [Wenzhouxiangella sp. AB-CW3]